MHYQFEYSDLVSRNYLYISDDIQQKIRNIKIAFFGTGLSSNIAEQCARLGIMHMHLNDGDKVELSNLNRQAFNIADIKHPKAHAVKEKIILINPDCEVSINTSYIKTKEDYQHEIDKCDIVINTVDCNQIYFDLIEYARTKNKLVICPFNPGYAGLVICFNKKSAATNQMFDLETQHLDDHEISKQLFAKFPQMQTLKQANTISEEFINKSIQQGYFPQINIGALITTALTLTTIIKFLKNEEIILAPEIFYLNCY